MLFSRVGRLVCWLSTHDSWTLIAYLATVRTGPINASHILKPTTPGDVATYLSFGLSGLYLFTFLGIALGNSQGKRMVVQDLERFNRIERSFRPLWTDAFRMEADILAKGDENRVYRMIGITPQSIDFKKEV